MNKVASGFLVDSIQKTLVRNSNSRKHYSVYNKKENSNTKSNNNNLAVKAICSSWWKVPGLRHLCVFIVCFFPSVYKSQQRILEQMMVLLEAVTPALTSESYGKPTVREGLGLADPLWLLLVSGLLQALCCCPSCSDNPQTSQMQRQVLMSQANVPNKKKNQVLERCGIDGAVRLALGHNVCGGTFRTFNRVCMRNLRNSHCLDGDDSSFCDSETTDSVPHSS